MSAADNGLSDAEPARKRGGRGRQPRKIVVDAASTSSRGADSSVPGTPVQPTQTVNPNDPLAMDELSILGVTAAENTLPVLHKEGQTAGDANAVNRTMNAVAATSRPKRPKSIKFRYVSITSATSLSADIPYSAPRSKNVDLPLQRVKMERKRLLQSQIPLSCVTSILTNSLWA